MVRVEFDPPGVDRFIQLADVLEDAFPSVMVEEAEGAVAREGAFEMTHEDGTVLFSKLDAGRAPEALEVLEALEAKLRADGEDPAAPRDGRGC